MTIIAIDPGANGGIAWRDKDGIVHAEPMPDGMTAQIDRLRAISVELPFAVAVVERVGSYMPGNSGPAAATFARHCGHLDAALYCLGIPIWANPTPQQWQKALATWPKDKPDRKRALKEWAARRFPTLTVTLKTADALAILAWADGRSNTIREKQSECDCQPAGQPCDHLVGEWQGCDEGGTFTSDQRDVYGFDVEEWFQFCPRCGVRLRGGAQE